MQQQSFFFFPLHYKCNLKPSDFERSECYHPPLELEDGAHEGTFLDTTFEWKGDRWAYRINNENQAGEEPKVWRYKDFRSHAPYAQKRALIR